MVVARAKDLPSSLSCTDVYNATGPDQPDAGGGVRRGCRVVVKGQGQDLQLGDLGTHTPSLRLYEETDDRIHWQT
jgi:hypothetical protein